MYIFKFILIVLVSLLIAACNQNTSKISDEEKQAALQSAEKWLSLVDEGKYGESWEEAASIFRDAMPKDKWIDMLSSFRSQYGKVIQREELTKKYTTSISGLPNGEYVVIKYKMKTENNIYALKAITLLKEKDGIWKVTDYYIEK